MKLRYVELSPKRIFNRLGPENCTAAGAFGSKFKETWWEPDVIELRLQFAEAWMAEFDRIIGHFSKLELSIRDSGIHHPISVVSGPPRGRMFDQEPKLNDYFPPWCHRRPKQTLYTQPFGGSRLLLAQKMQLDSIPCIVHDYSNLFPNAVEVTRYNYTHYFGMGNHYTFRGRPPCVTLSRFSHIENKKHESLNVHVKRAQRIATQTALKKIGLSND